MSMSERRDRRMPYEGSAFVLILLAIGVFLGAGLRGWTIALPMLIVAAALFLWAQRD